jgi:hypothetical protein
MRDFLITDCGEGAGGGGLCRAQVRRLSLALTARALQPHSEPRRTLTHPGGVGGTEEAT